MDIEKIQRELPEIAKHAGPRFTRVEKDVLEAEMEVRPQLCNPMNALHGGAIMACADTMGAIGTWVNLRDGQGTTTLESKTNFFAAAPLGMVLTARGVPLHRGRSTQVWETSLTRPDGRLVAKVTQTQMVLSENPAPRVCC